MINGKKLVIVTPSGRKRYMEILLKYILRERSIIDEYRIWVNTKNEEDLKYFKKLNKEYQGFITLDERFKDTPECGSNTNIHRFFDQCIESDTIYIRLDDDIVWLEPNFIETLAKFRIENPQPFLVYGTILNNSLIDSVIQKLGLYNYLPPIGYDCLDPIGWGNPQVCEKKHMYLFDTYLNYLKTPPKLFEKWSLYNYERVSINCISWLGETFAEFEGKVGEDEEQWLSVIQPRTKNTPNIIYGGAYCIHYAFHTQREHLDNTNILKQYFKISNYLNIPTQNLDFSKIKWDTFQDITKILIYQILLENENINILNKNKIPNNVS